MTHWSRWWRELTEADRFRLYTRLTSQGVLLAVAVTSAIALGEPWPAAAILVAGAASVAAIEARPELALWQGPRLRRRVTGVATWTLVLVALACAATTRTSSDAALVDAALVDAARSATTYVVVMGALTVIPFVRQRWWVLLAVAVVTGAALASSPGGAVRITLVVLVLGGFVASTMLLSLWALRVVEDLERARLAEARLQVAEERLRFSRDLHDVVGRGFSAVAVKSELAATLSRAAEAERAAREMDEVKLLAVQSMDQLRALVRGYRDISLAAEVDGAASLLSSAGCQLTVEGEAAKVPHRFHEVAAWVVREGTTNIVKHSSARTATLTLGAEGMSLRNDAIRSAAGAPSGQLGLSERLAAVGASMTTATLDDIYVLEVRWEAL